MKTLKILTLLAVVCSALCSCAIKRHLPEPKRQEKLEWSKCSAKESPDTFAAIWIWRAHCEELLRKNEEIRRVYDEGIVGCEDPNVVFDHDMASWKLDNDLAELEEVVSEIKNLLEDLEYPCMAGVPAGEILYMDKITKLLWYVVDRQEELLGAVQPAK